MAFYSPHQTKCFNTQHERAPSRQTQRYNALNKFGFSQRPCLFSGSMWYKPLDHRFLAHVFIPALTNLSISWKLQNPNRLSALAALQLLSDLLLCLPQCFQPGLAAEKGRKSSQQSEERAYVKPYRLINYCWHYCWHTLDIYMSDSRVSSVRAIAWILRENFLLQNSKSFLSPPGIPAKQIWAQEVIFSSPSAIPQRDCIRCLSLCLNQLIRTQ